MKKSVLLMILITCYSGCSGKQLLKEFEEAPNRDPASEKRENVTSPAPTEAQIEEGKKGAKTVQKNTEANAEYHFSMAQAYVAEGNPDRAIEEFKLTLMFDPAAPLVYTRLATEYIKKGMITAAMESCKEALHHDPNFIDARLMLAGLYSTSHDNDAALVEYDRVLKSDPKHEEATIFKAQVLVESGRGADASRLLKDFVKKSPDSFLAWYYLGRAEQNVDHTDEAIIAFKKAIEIRTGFNQAYLALGYLYEEKGRNKDALATYKTLYDENQDITAASRIATILLKEEKYADSVA
ncbi:MAG: tetratricopeptide repeat protein, partial [Bdellovibrionota bacterium]